MNVENDEVVARGYEKFFNIGEKRETEITHLATKFKEPIICYEKYNGYLGILSIVNGELFFASKSTNQNEHSEWFKQMPDMPKNLQKYVKTANKIIERDKIKGYGSYISDIIETIDKETQGEVKLKKPKASKK
jgi:tRNA splicing ligase